MKVVYYQQRRYGVSFMSHHSTAAVGDYWQRACEAAGWHYIDPAGLPTETAIRSALSAPKDIPEQLPRAFVEGSLDRHCEWLLPWLTNPGRGEAATLAGEESVG